MMGGGVSVIVIISIAPCGRTQRIARDCQQLLTRRCSWFQIDRNVGCLIESRNRDQLRQRVHVGTNSQPSDSAVEAKMGEEKYKWWRRDWLGSLVDRASNNSAVPIPPF